MPNPETCLGPNMDCGRSLPCPDHPRPYQPSNPQCPAHDSSGLDCAGPSGHPDGSDHANINGAWSSGGES